MYTIEGKPTSYLPDPQKDIYIYTIYIYIYNGHSAQAQGLEANSPGYEKGGSEIEALKTCGALALRFLSGDDPYSHLFQGQQ